MHPGAHKRRFISPIHSKSFHTHSLEGLLDWGDFEFDFTGDVEGKPCQLPRLMCARYNDELGSGWSIESEDRVDGLGVQERLRLEEELLQRHIVHIVPNVVLIRIHLEPQEVLRERKREEKRREVRERVCWRVWEIGWMKGVYREGGDVRRLLRLLQMDKHLNRLLVIGQCENKHGILSPLLLILNGATGSLIRPLPTQRQLVLPMLKLPHLHASKSWRNEKGGGGGGGEREREREKEREKERKKKRKRKREKERERGTSMGDSDMAMKLKFPAPSGSLM
jgi:hypothetical protein